MYDDHLCETHLNFALDHLPFHCSHSGALIQSKGHPDILALYLGVVEQ